MDRSQPKTSSCLKDLNLILASNYLLVINVHKPQVNGLLLF